MKLWIKISVVVLLLVVVAATVSSVIPLGQSRALMIEREIAGCAELQGQAIQKLYSSVHKKRLGVNYLVLSKGTVLEAVKESTEEMLDFFYGIAFFDEEHKVICSSNINANDYSEMLDELTKERDDIFRICKSGDKTVIRCVSSFVLEEYDFVLATEHNVSDVYKSWEGQLDTLNVVNIAVGLGVSVITILLLVAFLSPLATVNKGLKEITEGNYDHKIPEKGSYEFKYLSRNINRLSQSVSTNVDKLKSISEGRKRFIDNFAHEMKTPLTSIIGFSSLLGLNKNISKEKTAEYADIIQQEAGRLKSLSGKLLELSTAEHTVLDFSPVEVSALFGEVKGVMEHALTERGCSIVIECDDSVINIDKELFKSLLYNLIDNAAKASYPSGKIVLGCRSSDGETVLSVADEGIGMEESHLKEVFEPFFMVDKARSRSENGAGLGLALCAEIARQHNAVIDISSELGVGTTVYVHLKREDNNG